MNQKNIEPYHYFENMYRKPSVHYMLFYVPQRGKHIVAALSVRLSVCPVPCPANNFKTAVGI